MQFLHDRLLNLIKVYKDLEDCKNLILPINSQIKVQEHMGEISVDSDTPFPSQSVTRASEILALKSRGNNISIHKIDKIFGKISTNTSYKQLELSTQDMIKQYDNITIIKIINIIKMLKTFITSNQKSLVEEQKN